MDCRRLLAAVVLASGFARADQLKVPADFEKIQAAVDVAQPGDEVVISAGNYAELVTLSGKQDLVVRGKGKVVLTSPATATVVITVSAGSSNVRLEHLHFADAMVGGIQIDGSTDVTVSQCSFDNMTNTSLRGGTSSGLLFDRCTVHGSANGILLDTVDTSTVRRCKVFDVTANGILVSASVNCTIDQCTVDGTGNVGLLADGTGAAETMLVQRCLVRNAQNAAILSDGTGVRLFKNRVLGTLAEGIIDDGDADEIVSNRIVKPAGRGIYAAATGATLLDGNKVLHAGAEGILINDGVAGGTATGNKVIKPAQSGLATFGSALQIQGNVITGAGTNGFEVHASGGTYTGNTAKGSVELDLFQELGQTNTYDGNHFKTDNLP